MAMPPGPPPPSPSDNGGDPEQPQMSPQEAQQVLAKFGITKPEDIQLVTMACEALEPPDEDDQGGGAPNPSLIAALSKRYQGGGQ